MISVAPATVRSARVRGIDVLRGVVMVLMAIDHVRLYGGVPAGGVTYALFFTRWVTHFCAPVFAFLTGTSAFLSGRTLSVGTLSGFLLTRGLLLVVLELTVIKFFWDFNLDYGFMLAGGIWMLGWCMVLMAALVRLGPKAAGLTGVAIIFLQPLFRVLPALLPHSVQEAIGPFWAFVYAVDVEPAGGVSVLYVLVPWIGVMAAGYGFGAIVTLPDQRANRWPIRIGLAATALFLLIAIPLALFQQTQPNSAPLLIRILNQNKYPATPLFLMMTLGPALALLPLANRATGWLARVFETFGRVPLFYYLLHIAAIHLAAIATAWLRGDGIHPDWYATAPYAQVPPAARWSLGQVYLVFATVVTLLYFPCAWYARLRARPERPPWTRYL